MKLCECGCGGEVAKEGNRVIRGHNNRKEKIIINCLQCDKEIQVIPSKKKHIRKFCSQSCCNNYNKHNTGENNPNWKERITKTCLGCKKLFQVLPSQEDQKFCSISCKDSFQTGENSPNYGKKLSDEHRQKISEALSGENHPCWNPNLTDEDRQHTRHYYEYYEWRDVVLKRDDYTCQKCLKRGCRLIAHHLESYNANKELRTTLSNGVTLCKTCHDNFHHIYGRGNNTKQQYLEWLIT